MDIKGANPKARPAKSDLLLADKQGDTTEASIKIARSYYIHGHY